MDNNNISPSLLGPQNLGLGTSQSQAGSSKPQMVSGSHHLDPKTVPSTTAGGSKVSNGHGGAQGSGGRGRWVNRILIGLGLRSRNQFKDATSDAESQKRSSQRRLSSWLKRGLLRKEKKNKGKAPETPGPQTPIHNKVASFEESVDPREKEKKATKNRLSVVPEHPRLSRIISKKTKASISRQIGPEAECELDPHTVDTDGSGPPRKGEKGDEQEVPGGRAPLLAGQTTLDAEPKLSTQSREEQQHKQLESTSQSIADLYAASFQHELGPKNPNDPRVTDGKGNLEFGLNAANISALGKNGVSDQRYGKQPQRLVTAGWLASLPSTSDISQLRRDSFSAEAVKEASGAEQFRQDLHQESPFGFGSSGGFVRGTSSIQHLASSRHPIADAHAEEWRRRTVGGPPIPERYSSRWRPRSRCPSSRRCGSIDSRQTTYNPYDLPTIPRQPLFTELVDLLSLSKAVNSSLNNGNGQNNNGTTQNKPATIEVDRINSFSSTISRSNKGAGGSGDWSSLAGGHGENTSSTLLERSGSGSGRGSRLAQQPSSSGDASTITNTTITTAPPLFQNYLLPAELQGSGLGINLSEGFMASHEESELQPQQRVEDKGKGKMTMTTPSVTASRKSGDIDFNSTKPSSEIFPAEGIPRSSETSGGGRGSGDSSVPEAWWTNKGQPFGHLAYGYGFGGGRPSTPTSPMSRRREKWNVRKRRERENNR